VRSLTHGASSAPAAAVQALEITFGRHLPIPNPHRRWSRPLDRRSHLTKDGYTMSSNRAVITDSAQPGLDRRLGGPVALAILLLAAPASAQWTKQSPIPTRLGVHGVAAPAADRVFLATADDPFDDGGALFESADGGATWTQRDVPFSLGDGLNGIFFLDSLHGWAWGNANYRTTDGGTTWTELPFLGSAYFMEFSTPDFGVTTGNFGAFVSTDGGLTWDPSPNDMFAFDFADALTGVGISGTGLYRTADGGATFAPVYAGDATAVAFLSPSVAVAIVDDTFVRSTNGGLNWTPGSSAEGRSHLTVVSPTVVLAWGRSGSPPAYDDRVFRSADGGATWSDLGEVMDLGGFAFAVPAAPTVVAADLAGNLHHSPDGGQTWSQVFTSPGPFPSFLSSAQPAFGDPQTGYFAFGPGFVVKTSDGGVSWQQISSGVGEPLNAIDRFADGSLVAVGDNGALLTSTGAIPWILRERFTTSSIVAVEVIGPQEAVAVDETARVYTTADGGATWVAAPAAPASLDASDLAFSTPLDGWLAGFGGAGGAVFHTTDGGASWTPAAGFSGAYVAVDFEGQSGWAANVGGIYYRTIDGGATWELGNLPGSVFQIQDMEFFDVSIGYAVGWWGYAVRSDDGGLTWQVLPTPDPDHQLTDIDLIGPNELWVSTNSGVALYSANGGQSWAVIDTGTAGPGSFSAIAASPAGDAWMAGWFGEIQHFAGPPPPPVNRPPAASFGFQTTGLSVEFTDTSSDPDGTIVSWLWDFGDGATSTVQHPSHLFPGADTYIVRLTVTDDVGDTGSAVRFIVVQPGPGGTWGDFTEVTPLDPLFVTPQDEDFWVASTAAADYDSDGDLDIAVLGFYVVYNVSVVEQLVLIRNDGPLGPDEWEFSYVDLPLGDLTAGASDLAWGDVDGDGDQDLVVGSDNLTVLYSNDGGVLTQTDTVLPPYWEDNDQAEFDLQSISWADVDNDGDLDLLLPSVWDGGLFEFRTALMLNDGPNGTGGRVFTEQPTALAPTPHAQSLWADFDGDLDLDLLLVNLAPLTSDGFIRRYRNDGGGVFLGEDILGSISIEHGQAQWGDYDDDGDLDILIAGLIREADGTFNTTLRIYRDDAGSHTPVEVIACPACEGWIDLTAATWADYDSDGDVDILLAGNYNSGSQIEGRAKVYDNTAGVFSDSGNQLPAPRASGSRGGSFTWLDLDNDGDLDYFIAGQYFVPGGNGLVEAQMHAYRNDAGGTNDAPSAPSDLASTVDPDTGDVALWWSPATDDLTPEQALTYDLRLYRNGAPASLPDALPEPGGLSAVGQWNLAGLSEGVYTWTLQALDSALNAGPTAEETFIVGDVDPTLLFADGFESGDLGAWTVPPR
jgi:photosystem II stability/assembly factor-like uncharacterized protein